MCGLSSCLALVRIIWSPASFERLWKNVLLSVHFVSNFKNTKDFSHKTIPVMTIRWTEWEEPKTEPITKKKYGYIGISFKLFPIYIRHLRSRSPPPQQGHGQEPQVTLRPLVSTCSGQKTSNKTFLIENKRGCLTSPLKRCAYVLWRNLFSLIPPSPDDFFFKTYASNWS